MDNLETIVIDEVSMLRRDQFELIDIVLSSVKDNPLPFGGVQMVLVGDFFQLPPVAKGSEDNRFVTESNIWHNMDIRICYLDEQHTFGSEPLVNGHITELCFILAHFASLFWAGFIASPYSMPYDLLDCHCLSPSLQSLAATSSISFSRLSGLRYHSLMGKATV